jgi:hypothetical protein
MEFPLDLFVLVADADQKAAVQGLLGSREASLGIRPCRFDVQKHPQRDPGCVGSGVELLATVKNQAEHGLLIFDREGCGREDATAEVLERELDSRLDQSGWDGRARTVVIDPETEILLWSDSPHVAETFGWASDRGDLRDWLRGRNLLQAGQAKPTRPKEAMLAVLGETGVKASAANFGAIARKVSLERCQDRSFLRLRDLLRSWFGGGTPARVLTPSVK